MNQTRNRSGRLLRQTRRATEFSLGSRAAARGRLLSGNPAAIGRGQGALEYLMTYAWAILIIVIIGGALYALGIFNPMTWLAGSKRATGFSNIEVRDWALKSDGLTIVLGNKAGKALVVTAITAVRIGGVGSCTASYSQTLADNDLVTLHPGTSSCASGLRTGNGYSLETEITFTLAGSSHTETGTITGKLE